MPRRVFTPSLHLAYEPPVGCYTFADLGYPPDTGGISPLAVTAPFSLFTPSAVRELRSDVLSRESIDLYGVRSKFALFQTREHPRDVAPFVWQVWKHPEVLQAVSDAAGIELVPMYGFIPSIFVINSFLCPQHGY
jgi:hypothetical protein